jgi:hypothetical protein
MTRPLCPFYGFSWPKNGSHLFDKGDNRCALDLDVENVCAMERERLPINYRTCRLYQRYEHVANIGGGHITLHPREFPQGISLRDWINYLSRQR